MPETLRTRARPAQRDRGGREGMTAEMRVRPKALEHESREPRRADEIPRKAPESIPSLEPAAQRERLRPAQGRPSDALQGIAQGKVGRTIVCDKPPVRATGGNGSFRLCGRMRAGSRTSPASPHGPRICGGQCRTPRRRSTVVLETMTNKVSLIEAFARRIVGRRASRSMEIPFVLDAPEQVPDARRPAASCIAAAGAFDALAETAIALLKTEAIRRRGPWRSLEALEFATLEQDERSNS